MKKINLLFYAHILLHVFFRLSLFSMCRPQWQLAFIGRDLTLVHEGQVALSMNRLIEPRTSLGWITFSLYQVSLTSEIVTVHVLYKYTNTKPSAISLGISPHQDTAVLSPLRWGMNVVIVDQAPQWGLCWATNGVRLGSKKAFGQQCSCKVCMHSGKKWHSLTLSLILTFSALLSLTLDTHSGSKH